MCPASVNINSMGTGHLWAWVKAGTETPKGLYKDLARRKTTKLEWVCCLIIKKSIVGEESFHSTVEVLWNTKCWWYLVVKDTSNSRVGGRLAGGRLNPKGSYCPESGRMTLMKTPCHHIQLGSKSVCKSAWSPQQVQPTALAPLVFVTDIRPQAHKVSHQ